MHNILCIFMDTRRKSWGKIAIGRSEIGMGYKCGVLKASEKRVFRVALEHVALIGGDIDLM